MYVSERAEEAFIAYIYDLALRHAASSRVRQDESDETAQDGPEGPRGKDSR